MSSRLARSLTVFSVAALVTLAFSLSTFAQAKPPAKQAPPSKDPFAGTWTLNLGKSKYDPGPAPKTASVVFTSTGTSVKAAIDGVSGTGEKMHWEYTAAFDGKDHPMTGNPDGDMIMLKRVSASSVQTTVKLKGKVTVVNVRTVAADGKTMTVTTKGTNAQGQKVNNTQVFDKKM